MANNIKIITEKNGNNVFPITHERAVRDSEGVTLETKLANINGIDANFYPQCKIKDSATLTPDSGRAVSIMFPVAADDVIVWTYNGASDSSCGFTLFNESKEYLTYYSMNTSNSRTFTLNGTTTSLARYAMATFRYDASTGKINDGSKVTRNGVVAWEPIYTHQAITNDSIKKIQQDLWSDEKEQAVENIGLEISSKLQDANYTTGGYLTSNGKRIASSDWYITDFIPFTSGSSYVWNFGDASRVGTDNPCLIFYDENHNYLNYNSCLGYYQKREQTITLTDVCYIRASFSKTIGGELNTVPVIIDGTPFKLTKDVRLKYNNEDDSLWKPLPLSKLENYHVSNGELSHSEQYDPINVACLSIMALPFEGVTIRFRAIRNIPELWECIIWYGGANGTITNYKYLRGNTSEEDNSHQFTLPMTAKSYRICFRKRFRYEATQGYLNYVSVTATEVNNMLAAGTLVLEYKDVSANNVVERNIAAANYIDACRRVLYYDDNKNNGMDKLPMFAHISDLHGDALRFRNAMEFCDKMGWVDAMLNTGDATLYNHPDGTSWVDRISGEHNTPMLFCIGNHESWPTGQATLFEDNMATLVTQQGYLKAEDTPADHCYYYKDFASKSIRFIALNYYEGGVYSGNLGQAQITWFINTLLSTPVGYGILIAIHSPEDSVVAESPYDKFMQPSPKYGDSYQPDGFYVGDRPIMHIIDAFIDRTTISTSYEDASETVTISADFSGVDNSTEFIAYVTGHRHEDNVGYYEHASQRQLCLGIVCGMALFGDSSNSAWTGQCDLPRGGKGVCQDAFNIYAIDRRNGNVRIARVGSNVTVRFAYRDTMELPYEKRYGTPLNFTPGYRTTANSSLGAMADRAATDYISVETGDEIIWSYGPANTKNVFCTFYDENKNYVTYFSAATNNSRTFSPASEGIKYCRATFYYDPAKGKVLLPASLSINGTVVWTPQYAPYTTE